VSVVGGLAVLAAVSGCGATSERVERTVVTIVKTVKAKPAGHEARAPRHEHSRAASNVAAARFVACDANISARRTTTTCPFAENTFYEYWASGEASSISAYSPATQRTYRLECQHGTTVRCTAGDGAEVRFPVSAVWAYTDGQAQAYAASADLGPTEPAPVDPGAYREAPSDETYSGKDDGYGDEIPNYDNGRGYRVQCADGMYSQSGGIQGACSGHGGVG